MKKKKELKEEELNKVAGGGDYEDIIKQLASNNLINGYDNNNFKPKESDASLINKIITTGICPLCKQNIFLAKGDIDGFINAKKHVYEECNVYKR